MKKNIAIVIQHLGGGGAEKVAANLSLYLPREKFCVKLIVFDGTKVDYPYAGELIDLELKASSNIPGRIINVFRRIRKLRKIKEEHKIDATISLLSSANLINILSRYNDKVIISVRNYVSKSVTGFYGHLNRLLIRLFYNKANHVVAVSHELKSDLIRNYSVESTKIKVINNFYDIDKIEIAALEDIEQLHQHLFRHPTIITVGRLSKQKGQWHLIRAFGKVKEKITDAKLLILGNGELENDLKALVKELRIEDVHFLGFKKNPFSYISRATVFAFPSLYEGFPNALCEAMACRLPVISSDCKSGPREILEPTKHLAGNDKVEYSEYGILVPVCYGNLFDRDELTKEEELLSEAISRILMDEKLRRHYSEKSFDRIQCFNIDNIIRQWEEIL